MGALIIVLIKPVVKIALQVLQALIQLFSEGDPVELVQHGLIVIRQGK